MELIIESKIKECNKDLSKNTIYTYIKNITKIVELMKITDLNIFYNDYETIINVIKTKYNDSDNSQRNKFGKRWSKTTC